MMYVKTIFEIRHIIPHYYVNRMHSPLLVVPCLQIACAQRQAIRGGLHVRVLAQRHGPEALC